MGRYKTLAGNTLIFGICNFTSKLLVFFMLPLYTAVLSKEQFGIADLITTTVGLLYPFLSLGISEGCMRYALDKSYDDRQVFSIGIKVLMAGFILLLLLSPFVKQINGLDTYYIYFIFLYITTVANSFLNFFGRGIQKVKVVGIAGVVCSFTAVGANLVFLLIFKWGIQGYLLSMIVAHVAACIVLVVGGNMYKYITLNTPKPIFKEIIQYSLPMVPNKLSWWTNHSANRYILASFCSVADVGLYSAAARMPAIIDTFRGIFIEAWQLSTITEYDKKDSTAFFQNIYQVYNVFMILLCSSLIIMSQLIGSILYSKTFYEAWIYTPLLLLGVFYGSLVAYYSPVYLAYKKTNKLFLFTLLGAVITIIMNFILIPLIGIYGAAISSVLSYFSIYITMEIDSRKYIKIQNRGWKYKISYIILTIQAFLISFGIIIPLGICSVGLFCLLIIICREELMRIVFITRTVLNKKVLIK